MYILYKFGTYELPNWNPKDDLSTAEARPSFYEFPDARLDYYKTDRVPLVPVNVTKSVDLYQEEDYLAVRALVGQREKLYRKLDSDDSLQWNYARCLQLKHNREYVRDKCRISVDLEFALLSAFWNAENATSVADTIDASVDTFSLPNNGNYPVSSVIIEITAPSSFGPDSVQFIFSMAGKYHFSWSGTMSGDDVLTINTGSKTVLLNDTSAYSGFSLNSTLHKSSSWLILEPGSNTLTINNSKSTGDITEGMWHGTRVIPTYSNSSIAISDFTISITYYNAYL